MEQKPELKAYQAVFLENLQLLSEIANHKPDVKDSLKMFFYMYSCRIVESSDSLLLLSVHRRLSDCYAIARMVLETAVNIAYISTKPSELINKSLDHALQKTYRDLDRILEIGDLSLSIKFSEIDNIAKTDRLKNSLKEYTNSTGHEIRDWLGIEKKSINEKIKVITEVYGVGYGNVFMTCMFAIYRHSSELIHGTTFGTMFINGLTNLGNDWPNNEEDLEKHQTAEMINILYSLGLVVNVSCRIFLKHFENKNFEKKVLEYSKHFTDIRKNK